jgi:transcription termination/antitermination protein NusA
VQGNEIIMAARAHWFADEEPAEATAEPTGEAGSPEPAGEAGSLEEAAHADSSQ